MTADKAGSLNMHRQVIGVDVLAEGFNIHPKYGGKFPDGECRLAFKGFNYF